MSGRRGGTPRSLLGAACAAGLLLAAAPAAAAPAPASWAAYTAAGLRAREAGRYADAEAMLVAALRLAEAGAPAGRRLATSLANLAELYAALHRYAEAEGLLRRAVAVEEQRVGPGHPAVANLLADYLVVLRMLGREADVRATEARLREILAAASVRAPRLTWEKPGAGPEALEQDEEACRNEARYGTTPYGPLLDAERFTGCVEARGWRRTVVTPPAGTETGRP